MGSIMIYSQICELDCAEGERIDYSSIQGGERDEESRMVVVIGAAVYLRSSLFNNRYPIQGSGQNNKNQLRASER